MAPRFKVYYFEYDVLRCREFDEWQMSSLQQNGGPAWRHVVRIERVVVEGL